ncbi:sulfotransferase family cytosolic 1B member 1-like [Limulus polyphemus]|uniref:Sulfotransferase family cytosolic 1B member 1-like n=1 Tax=Limulus polyphemus TaxID=6850 RepID=A0ABM1BSJ8_LIMPO|nr:sulfotransferase family cytosolic 1B member 1-like [Limulus polyphemus]
MKKPQNEIVPVYQVINGRKYPRILPRHILLDALNYTPEKGDIFIASYPKSGMTWMQHIVLLILNNGKQHQDHMEFIRKTPFLDAMGSQAIREMPKPGPIKTHFPFHLVPYSSEAKYIYVARNPKDNCVSYFHHHLMFPMYRFQNGTFNTFFELFVTGETISGDYFDNLMSWYPHRGDHNVLFVTYEEMKTNIREVVLKVAGFLHEECLEMLKADEELLQRILYYTSFDYMKKTVNRDLESFFKTNPLKFLMGSTPPGLRAGILNAIRLGDLKTPDKPNFIRKGIVGDWKNYMTEDQSKRLDEKFLKVTQGTDLPQLWKEYMQLT